jgi:hypothetical protein
MMSIETTESQIRFEPAETIRGTVSWRMEDDPRTLELRLFWYTKGKGDQDVEVVDKVSLQGAAGRTDFSFTLPEEPYSFSGRLISLVWALELVSEGPDETCRFEFVLSPTGEEILLGR